MDRFWNREEIWKNRKKIGQFFLIIVIYNTLIFECIYNKVSVEFIFPNNPNYLGKFFLSFSQYFSPYKKTKNRKIRFDHRKNRRFWKSNRNRSKKFFWKNWNRKLESMPFLRRFPKSNQYLIVFWWSYLFHWSGNLFLNTSTALSNFFWFKFGTNVIIFSGNRVISLNKKFQTIWR